MTTEIQISGDTATVVSPQGPYPPPDMSTPLIKFPPFPETLEGASIIPFSQFRPKGIKKRLVPDSDYPDLDGHGRPTVRLKVAHTSTSSDKWKKKKRRFGEGDDGVVRRYVWYEEWAKEEDSRKTLVDYSMPLADRLIQAACDFKERSWGNIVLRLNETFDAFRVYVGLLSSHPIPTLNKGIQNGSDDDDDEEDYEEEMAAYNPITDPTKAGGDLYPLIDPSEAERHPETKEERAMRVFLKDPERALKIFFTSYFIDRGLMWKESRCVDAPELVRFFISFLIRNNVYSDVPLNDKLKRCLKFLETARKELPATFAISKALDDPFSKGCCSLWGRTVQTIDLGEEYAEPPKTQKMEELENAIIDHDKITSREGTWMNVGEEIEGGDNTNGWGTWGQPQTGGGGGGGWGSAVEGGWGSAGKEYNSFDDNPESGWNVDPLPTLTTLLGPTNLPLTHTTGIFEASMRKIVGLIPPSVMRAEGSLPDSPASGVEEGLDRRFGKIVLGPWIGWDCGRETILDKPTILPRSRCPVKTESKVDQEVEGAHDPYKDNITVLVEPAALKTMVIGVGISANWVQITRADEDGNPAGGGRDMWYMEQVTHVIPSFYLA
ncbi:hypothetical protein BDM02DRAFT_3110907 [Thelephora ganbajun]|uniref:Uncharacterized protein n=1 Tax=Thelephora ganbajun TaxID=370292 RepID=A0ACB6ZP30_THEGA|nr:hypothetical protein BDM02DRAFT_3110907 [Thelephora ganbajun]